MAVATVLVLFQHRNLTKQSIISTSINEGLQLQSMVSSRENIRADFCSIVCEPQSSNSFSPPLPSPCLSCTSINLQTTSSLAFCVRRLHLMCVRLRGHCWHVTSTSVMRTRAIFSLELRKSFPLVQRAATGGQGRQTRLISSVCLGKFLLCLCEHRSFQFFFSTKKSS